jgi:hypothetical protein
VPIKFDRRFNEYHFRASSKRDGSVSEVVIYHCPFCGGTAPESTRSQSFAVVGQGERERLLRLLADVKSAEDVVPVLGKPNSDRKVRSNAGAQRTLVYSHLSDVADIYVSVTPDKRVSASIAPKYLKEGGRVRRRRAGPKRAS